MPSISLSILSIVGRLIFEYLVNPPFLSMDWHSADDLGTDLESEAIYFVNKQPDNVRLTMAVVVSLGCFGWSDVLSGRCD